MWRKKVITVVFCLHFIAAPCHAQFGFGGASLVFDPKNHLENVQQVLKSIVQIKNQIDMINNMMQHTKNQKGQWSANRLITLSNQLNGTLSQGITLSRQYGDLRTQFQQRYPGVFTAQGASLYGQQQQGVLDTIANALQAGDQITQHLRGVHTLLNTLALVTDSAGGRMQALQSIANIAETTSTNISLLAQQTKILHEAQLQYYAAKQSQEMQTQGLNNVWITNGVTTVPAANGTGWSLPRPIP